MPSLSARSITGGVAERAARRMGSYFGRVQSPRIIRSGFWDCHQMGLRTSEGEGQRTGSSGIFDVALLCPSPCWAGATKGADADFSPQLRDALARGFFPAVAGRACARISECEKESGAGRGSVAKCTTR